MKLEYRKILTLDVSKQADCLALVGFQKECISNGMTMRVLVHSDGSPTEVSVIAEKEEN